MRVWPFKPRSEVIETLEWLTDIFRARAGEQRTCLREAPRRSFSLTHILQDYEYAHARALIRAEEDFLVPDWAQSTNVGSVSAGSDVVLAASLPYVDMGDKAMLWQSNTTYEVVDVDISSNGVTADVVGSYTGARLVPVWPANTPAGLSVSRNAARYSSADITFGCTENNELSASAYSQYKGHDIVTECPVIGSGSFDESISWPLSEFDNQTGLVEYIRSRTYPDNQFQMRWHVFEQSEKYTLRQWLHSRYGRQKAFWLSSRAKDFEVVSLAGSTLTVTAKDGLEERGVFDIDITGPEGSEYFQVDSVTDLGSTLELNLSGSPTVSSITRASYFRLARFGSDRIELNHSAGGGMAVQVPCVEVPA